MTDLSLLLRRISDLQAKVDSTPRLEWGTVAQSSPLRIVPDGSVDMLLFTPDTLVKVLVPGERVRYERQNLRVTILGVAGRPRGIPQGTTSQMSMLTSAPDGARFYNTTDTSEYVRAGGIWSPVMQAAETLIKSGAAANTEYSVTVTFDKPFGRVPAVVATTGSADLVGSQVVAVANATATGFKLTGKSTVARNLWATWIAHI